MTVRESNHRHTSNVFLTFFCRFLHYHVHPTISDHKIPATADVSAFMPVQAGQNLHECNSCLAGDETRVLQIEQEQPFFFPKSTLHVRHVHVLFRLCGKWFLLLPPPSHDHKDGSLVAVIFNKCFFAKARRGALLQPPRWVDCQTQHLSSSTLSALLSDVSLESSSDAVRLMHRCKSFMWQGIRSTRNDCRLNTFVTRSNFMVQWLCGALTHTWCTQDLETLLGRQLPLPLIHISESCYQVQSGVINCLCV